MASRSILIPAISSGCSHCCPGTHEECGESFSCRTIRHPFFIPSRKAIRTAGLDARGRIAFSSGATIFVRDANGSIRWFRTLPPLPIPQFRSTDNASSLPESRKPQDPWQIWEIASCGRRAAPHHFRSRRLRSSFLSARRSRGLCAPKSQADS